MSKRLLTIPGYQYVKRVPNGYNEISLDPKSNKFHPTQIMSAMTLYSFPPYDGAGLADLASFLTSGARSTHLNDNNSIMGFTIKFVLPMKEKQEVFQKTWPEMHKYSQQVIKDGKLDDTDDTDHINDLVKDIEKKFGTSITLNLKERLSDPYEALVNYVGKEKVIFFD